MDLLRARRAALFDRIESGVAVLQAAAERSADPRDSDYPQDTDFRQDNDVFYLTGLEERLSFASSGPRPLSELFSEPTPNA